MFVTHTVIKYMFVTNMVKYSVMEDTCEITKRDTTNSVLMPEVCWSTGKSVTQIKIGQ